MIKTKRILLGALSVGIVVGGVSAIVIARKQTKPITKLLTKAGGAIAIGGGLLLFGNEVRKIIKDKVVDKRERQALVSSKQDEQRIAQIAMRLKNAFDGTWWDWTDEDEVYASLEEIKNKNELKKVAIVYKQMYGNELMRDLRDDLDDREFKKALDIINSKK